MSESADNQAVSSVAKPPLAERRKSGERRAVTLWTFLRGTLSPRRRGGRRAGESDLPVDFHEPWLLVLAIAMLLLSVVDAFLTVTLMNDGAAEANPVLAFVLDEHPRLFAVVKMALTGLSVVVLVAVARMRVFKLVPARLFLQGLVAGYLALVCYELWLARGLG